MHTYSNGGCAGMAANGAYSLTACWCAMMPVNKLLVHIYWARYERDCSHLSWLATWWWWRWSTEGHVQGEKYAVFIPHSMSRFFPHRRNQYCRATRKHLERWWGWRWCVSSSSCKSTMHMTGVMLPRRDMRTWWWPDCLCCTGNAWGWWQSTGHAKRMRQVFGQKMWLMVRMTYCLSWVEIFKTEHTSQRWWMWWQSMQTYRWWSCFALNENVLLSWPGPQYTFSWVNAVINIIKINCSLEYRVSYRRWCGRIHVKLICLWHDVHRNNQNGAAEITHHLLTGWLMRVSPWKKKKEKDIK